MKRRQLVTNAAIGGRSPPPLAPSCGSASGSKVSADNLPNITWNMATSWPKSLETLFGTAELMTKRVAEMTNGRFKITPYAPGEIVGGLEVMDAVLGVNVQNIAGGEVYLALDRGAIDAPEWVRPFDD